MASDLKSHLSLEIDSYVRKVTQASLRRQIGFVLQDNILFGGTVAENIAFGYPTASQSEIEAAAQVAILPTPKK